MGPRTRTRLRARLPLFSILYSSFSRSPPPQRGEQRKTSRPIQQFLGDHELGPGAPAAAGEQSRFQQVLRAARNGRGRLEKRFRLRPRRSRRRNFGPFRFFQHLFFRQGLCRLRFLPTEASEGVEDLRGVVLFPRGSSGALRPLLEPSLEDGEKERPQSDDDENDEIETSAFRLHGHLERASRSSFLQGPFGFVPSGGSAIDFRISVSACRFLIP